jgi:hypothetical protein
MRYCTKNRAAYKINLIFLRDEIEGENFYLQNKTIGKNHVQWLTNFEYQAWYKAEKELHIGHEVTPKTNKGDYVIEETGNITVYAGEKVVMKPGFHAKAGSKFHAFIKTPECDLSNKSMLSTNYKENTEEQFNSKATKERLNNENQKESKKVKVYPNPNNGKFTLEVSDLYLEGEIMLFDTYGNMLYLEIVKHNKMQIIRNLERGVYYVTVINGNNKHVEKIVVQ